MWYVGTNIFAKAITFLATPIFTRILTPAEYGVYSLYIGWMGIFTVITTLEISGNIAFCGFSHFKNEREAFSSSAVGVQFTLTVFFTLLYIIFTKRVNAITGLTTRLTFMLILQVFFNSLIAIYFAEKRYLYKYKTVSRINLIIGLFVPVSAVFLILFTSYRGYARIISSLLISFVLCIPIVINTLKRCNRIFDFKKWKYIFGYALPLLPHYLGLSLIAQGDKILLSRLRGDAELGKYTVAYSVGFILSLVTGGLLSAITPWIHRKLDEKKSERIEDVFRLILKILFILTFIFLCAAPEIFSIIGADAYYSAIGVIYPVAVSVIFIFMSNVYSGIIMHIGKPSLVAANSAISAFFALFLGYFMINSFGFIGAAYSSLISYAVLFLLNLFTVTHIFNARLLTTKAVFAVFLITVSFLLLLIFIKDFRISRILVITALILTAIPLLPKFKGLISDAIP